MKNKGLATFEIILIVFIVVITIGGILFLLQPQALSKNLGGTVTITLDPGEKLEEITWKDGDLWYLTRPMRTGEVAETHYFKQSRNISIAEGEVIIIEQNLLDCLQYE